MSWFSVSSKLRNQGLLLFDPGGFCAFRSVFACSSSGFGTQTRCWILSASFTLSSLMLIWSSMAFSCCSGKQYCNNYWWPLQRIYHLVLMFSSPSLTKIGQFIFGGKHFKPVEQGPVQLRVIPWGYWKRMPFLSKFGAVGKFLQLVIVVINQSACCIHPWIKSHFCDTELSSAKEAESFRSSWIS